MEARKLGDANKAGMSLVEKFEYVALDLQEEIAALQTHMNANGALEKEKLITRAYELRTEARLAALQGSGWAKFAAVIGTTVIAVDALGHVIQWLASDAEPTYSPTVTYTVLKLAKLKGLTPYEAAAALFADVKNDSVSTYHKTEDKVRPVLKEAGEKYDAASKSLDEEFQDARKRLKKLKEAAKQGLKDAKEAIWD